MCSTIPTFSLFRSRLCHPRILDFLQLHINILEWLVLSVVASIISNTIIITSDIIFVQQGNSLPLDRKKQGGG
jgi:hypothetical protein